MVIATQNPVEHHGTYPLPESQLDRFLMRLRIGYPDAASEREILRNSEPHHRDAGACRAHRRGCSPIAGSRAAASAWMTRWWITCSPSSNAPARTNRSPWASARAASQALYRAVQALALVEGRDYAIPDDVKRLAAPVFAHRVVINTRTTLRSGAPTPASVSSKNSEPGGSSSVDPSQSN